MRISPSFFSLNSRNFFAFFPIHFYQIGRDAVAHFSIFIIIEKRANQTNQFRMYDNIYGDIPLIMPANELLLILAKQ